MTTKVYVLHVTDAELDRLIDLCEESYELSRGSLKSMTAPEEQDDVVMVLSDMKFVQGIRENLVEFRNREPYIDFSKPD
jgi:hypothetical protein